MKKWIDASANPKINHVIAQTDIHFSNSMIEAANKQLKYRFLYHQKIKDYSSLDQYLQKAIEDFNHPPSCYLEWLNSY
jgi:putative transposase